ncbi:hypothetical protein GCM10010245_44940 [Streptomyces spectabilis]|nr:hypothetical protein GCM10010245_44940 [Streptomyces spectabilis]
MTGAGYLFSYLQSALRGVRRTMERVGVFGRGFSLPSGGMWAPSAKGRARARRACLTGSGPATAAPP